MRIALVLALPLVLAGCVVGTIAKTAVDVAALPVKSVSLSSRTATFQPPAVGVAAAMSLALSPSAAATKSMPSVAELTPGRVTIAMLFVQLTMADGSVRSGEKPPKEPGPSTPALLLTQAPVHPCS